jgi:hypothetical protein
MGNIPEVAIRFSPEIIRLKVLGRSVISLQFYDRKAPRLKTSLFKDLLLALLLQYAAIWVDDQDAAALHDLSDQDFRLGWGMEFPEQ